MNPFGPSASPKPLWGRKLGIFDHLAAILLPIVALLGVFWMCSSRPLVGSGFGAEGGDARLASQG